MDARLKIWLPLDFLDYNGVYDLCGNIWNVAYGSPAIQNGKLFFNEANAETCLISDEYYYIAVGGEDFTIDAVINMNSSSAEDASIFRITLPYSDWLSMINVRRDLNANELKLEINQEATPSTNSMISCLTTGLIIEQDIHLELVYQYAAQIITLYINGVQAAQILDCPQYTRADCVFYIGEGFVGTLDNFRFFDGVALHTQNFIPPTTEKLINDFFPYYNPGTTEYFYNSWYGTTYTNLPIEKSKTGVAIGMSDANGLHFRIPSIRELWIKFDIYSDGNYIALDAVDNPSWSIANKSNFTTGISSDVYVGARFHLWNNGNLVATLSNPVVKLDNLQTVLLHMRSDETNGIIEVLIDDGDWYTYSGNVNNGDVFDDFRFTCNVEGSVLISNITISNLGIYDVFYLDVKRKVYETIWRYENVGRADLLKISGNTVSDLPVTQSRTGTAFWQKQRIATFPIPATKELWVKFDIYYTGTNCWRAYDRLNGNDTGIGRYSNTTTLICYINGPTSYDVNPKQALTTNTLHTVLLHMVSDSTNGLVEAWLDGVECYSDAFASDGVIYKGNVESGADFENFYIQSEDKTNLFSNVIISNAPIDLDDNVRELFNQHVEFIIDVNLVLVNENFIIGIEIFDVNTIISNILNLFIGVKRTVIIPYSFYFDVKRTVIIPYSFYFDVKRFIVNLFDVNTFISNIINVFVDVKRTVIIPYSFYFDVKRFIVNLFDVNTFISNIINVFVDIRCKIHIPDYYISIYKGNPTAGGTDGDVVSTGHTYVSPIEFNERSNEFVIIPLAIRVKNGYYARNVTIGFKNNDDNNFSLCKTVDGNYVPEISFEEVSNTNVVFFLRFNNEYSAGIPVNLYYGGEISSVNTLKAYLSFNNSVTKDFCNNTWNIFGSPFTTKVTINGNSFGSNSCLRLDGSSGLFLDDIVLGGSDFTIDGWILVDDSKNYNPVFSLFGNYSYPTIQLEQRLTNISLYQSQTHNLSLLSYSYDEILQSITGRWASPSDVNSTSSHHFAIVYQHKFGTLDLYIDGIKKVSQNRIIDRMKYRLSLGAVDVDLYCIKGYIDEFRVYDGYALYTEDFTVPSTEDYNQITDLNPQNSVPFYYNADILFKSMPFIKNGVTKVHLHFNDGIIEDTCGNTWVKYGNPLVLNNSLRLNGESYLSMSDDLILGDKSFLISCKFNLFDLSNDVCIFSLYDSLNDCSNNLFISPTVDANDSNHKFLDIIWLNYLYSYPYYGGRQAVQSEFKINKNTEYFVELYYDNDNNVIYIYLNNILIFTKKNTALFIQKNFTTFYIGKKYDSSNSETNESLTNLFNGIIDEFKIVEYNEAKTSFVIKCKCDIRREIKKFFSFLCDVCITYGYIIDVTREVTNDSIILISLTFDVTRAVKKIGEYLKAWLRFTNSPTEDICGNTWTTYGNPTIGTENAFNGKALQLDGQSYIKLSNVTLGGQDFYIDGWVYVDSSSPNYARVLSIVRPDTGNHMISVRKSPTDATKLDFWANSYAAVNQDSGYTYKSSINSVGERVHFKLLYSPSNKVLCLFINDKMAAKQTSPLTYGRRAFDIYIGALPNGNQGLIGSIDELRIYDGTWFSSGYGTPPSWAEYINNQLNVTGTADVLLNYDVKCKVTNPPLTWRYVNRGDADDLILTAPILTNLPATKSKTGTAFYQTTRAKCFDLPATQEIWIKFDVYFDGSNRWRAYNEGTAGACGVCSYVNYSGGDFGMWQNSTKIQVWTGICKTNQLQTVLLHMEAGSSDGVIEAWVDGTKIYTYTGDVNHGEDFADIDLQSDGAGTFFSNVLISNARIGLNDGYKSFTFDIARIVRNYPKLLEVLAVWLPFNNSPTEDLCGNTWTTSGNPTIGTSGAISGNALQLDGSSYLQYGSTFNFTGQPFTVSCRFSGVSNTTGGDVCLWQMYIANRNRIQLEIATSGKMDLWKDSDRTIYIRTAASVLDGQIHHAECDFDGSTWYLFLDGVLVGTEAHTCTARNYSLYIGLNYQTDRKFTGTIDEFQIYDGVALHTANFTPPTAEDYLDLKRALGVPVPFEGTFDVMRTIVKAVIVFIDIRCYVVESVVEYIDTLVSLFNYFDIYYDLIRIINNSNFYYVEYYDIKRNLISSVQFYYDLLISLDNNIISYYDAKVYVSYNVEMYCDIIYDILNQYTCHFDIIRNIIAPIFLPDSGNIKYTLSRLRIYSEPQKFILSETSKFYIYGDLVGKINIYSDTNMNGVVNGSYYFEQNSIKAEFEESSVFYISLNTQIMSPQETIKLFIHKLNTSNLVGELSLNRAITYVTDGKYVSWNNFINFFLSCLNSVGYSRFLDFYCDIILDNTDTGAITGWDAGGLVVKTADSIITESVPIDRWILPEPGSSVIIDKLRVHFPETGYNGTLTNAEKYILAGLNSEWIYRSLELIWYSIGVGFSVTDPFYDVYVEFSYNSSSSTLAYVTPLYQDGVIESLILTVNMYYYANMDVTDANGKATYVETYLDRILSHEITHVIMLIKNVNYDYLPEYIIEGLSELIHGIDDMRYDNIVSLLTTRKNDLVSGLIDEEYVYDTDKYAIGYILLRFLAKQGQHIKTNSTYNRLIINNFIIANVLSSVITTVYYDVQCILQNNIHSDVNIIVNNNINVIHDVNISVYVSFIFNCDVIRNIANSSAFYMIVFVCRIVKQRQLIMIDVNRKIKENYSNYVMFNVVMYGVKNTHINSVVFNLTLYGIKNNLIHFAPTININPSKTRTKLYQCIKPVIMLLIKPVDNDMIVDHVSSLALRSTPLYPDRSNKGYNVRG